MASDLPFYDILARQKVHVLKISDDVIECDLWFGPSPIKNPGYAYGYEGQIQHTVKLYRKAATLY